MVVMKRIPLIVFNVFKKRQREYHKTGRTCKFACGNVLAVCYVAAVLCLGLASPLAVLVKLSQVSFVGVPPMEWSSTEWVQFFAFINNLAAIGNEQAVQIRFFNSILFSEQICPSSLLHTRSMRTFELDYACRWR